MAAPLAIGGIAASILGGAVQAGGASASGDAAARMYRYRAALALQNAQIERQNADYAMAEGETSAMRYGISARQKMGQVIAQQGASNLDVNSGSNKAVQEGIKTVTKLDSDQIRANAARTAYNYQARATGYMNDALMGASAASDASAAGNISSTGSFIGTASSVASKWLDASKLGLFNFG